MNLQITLNSIAREIFRDQADHDYIAARSNFKMLLRQQFLWSAQQCIEKYLKAILLFNGKSARYVNGTKKEFSHDLNQLLDAVKEIEIFQFELEPSHYQFIKYLADQGPNRYLVKTAYNNSSVLQDLDSTVWHIRRYCQYMADRGLGCTEAVPRMREAVIAAALNVSHKRHPHKFKLFNGSLEKTLKRPKNDAARKALVWANRYYGTRDKSHIIDPIFCSFSIPPHERGWPDVDWEEVKQYVRL